MCRKLVVNKIRKEGWKMSREERRKLMAQVDALGSSWPMRTTRKRVRIYGIDRYPVVAFTNGRQCVRHDGYGRLVLGEW